MPTDTEKRQCLECGKNLMGRIDKKYCDELCRNAHNNRNKSQSSPEVRQINSILLKNRRILQQLIPEDKANVNRSKLEKAGFNFNYITHQYTTKKGSVYRFVYDYGYLPLDDSWFMLVKRNRSD